MKKIIITGFILIGCILALVFNAMVRQDEVPSSSPENMAANPVATLIVDATTMFPENVEHSSAAAYAAQGVASAQGKGSSQQVYITIFSSATASVATASGKSANVSDAMDAAGQSVSVTIIRTSTTDKESSASTFAPAKKTTVATNTTITSKTKATKKPKVTPKPTATKKPTATPKPAATKKPKSTTKTSSDGSSDNTIYVYITKYGECYHRTDHCGNTKHAYRVTLEYAKQMGYRPCKNCRPPQ
jgi:hypothetical protein